MYERLFIGNKLVSLLQVDSTNVYLKQLIANNDKTIEGAVAVAKYQFSGKGQQGNKWESENGKNLTFSIYLKPNILVQNQFLISKVISLGIIDFLDDLGINNLKIKWPNDIYCGDNKIAGILIENSLKGNKVYNSIVGIGLNVNQTNFSSENNPTSILKQTGEEQDLGKLLNQLLFFIEKRYVILKSRNEKKIDKDYLIFLFGLNESRKFKINNELISGEIIGVNSIGKLRVNTNKQIEEFGLKEIDFIF